MTDPLNPRWSRANRADDERKEILDPHYADEIAMLKRALRIPTVDGGEMVRERLAHLKKLAPFFDGRRMLGSDPCRCAACLAPKKRRAA